MMIVSERASRTKYVCGSIVSRAVYERWVPVGTPVGCEVARLFPWTVESHEDRSLGSRVVSVLNMGRLSEVVKC